MIQYAEDCVFLFCFLKRERIFRAEETEVSMENICMPEFSTSESWDMMECLITAVFQERHGKQN